MGLSPYDSEAKYFSDLIQDMQTLLNGRAVLVGDYNKVTGRCDPPTLRFPTRILILEGTHALALTVHDALPLNVRILFQAPEEVMPPSRRARDERHGVSGHTTTEWEQHYAAYQRDVLPERSTRT